MARYVVIEFTNTKDAESFFDKHLKNPQGRIVGMFAKPGKTCSCINWRHANYREDKAKHGFSGGVERGGRFGWWVCTRCNKPRRGTHQLLNLLSPSKTFEGASEDGWEFVVDSLSVGSLRQKNIKRKKKLRRKS